MLNRSINSSFNQSQVSSKSREPQGRSSLKDKQINQKVKVNVESLKYREGHSSEKNARVNKQNKEAGDGQFRWKLMEMPLFVEQAPAAAYHKIQMGHQWGTIDYRDSKYHGKILVTQTQCQSTQSPNQTIDFTSSMDSNFYTQTRDGPGILILDSNLWIIGQWKEDNLAGGNSVYVISSDGGVLELHLSEGEGVKDILSRVSEASFIGNTCSNNCLGANSHYNSVYNKANDKYSKYIIMGDRVNEDVSLGGKGEGEQGKCKWVVDLSQESYNKSKNNGCIYYLQTSTGRSGSGVDVNEIREISLDAEDRQKERVGNYDYFMSNLRKILVQLQPKSSEFGFKIIENKFTTINTTSITKPSGQLKTGQMNYNGIETIICSNAHNNESIYIRILAQCGDGNNNFGIEELALLVKEPISSQSSTAQNVQISIPNLQSFTYNRKYSYIIKQSSCSLSNSAQSLTAILPQIQVQEKLEGRIKNEGRYRYTYHYNCQQGHGKEKMYMASSNKEFALMCAEKKRQHLCSINFVDKSHKSLQHCLHKMLKQISFVYYQVKLFEIAQTNSNLATKMSGIKQADPIGNGQEKITEILHQQMEESKGKEREGEYLGRRRRNVNSGFERANTDGDINLASENDIKEELQKILQEGQHRSRSKGQNVNLNLEAIRNPSNVQVGQTFATSSARSKIENTRFGASGIRKRTYTTNEKQRDEQKIEQYVENSGNNSRVSWVKGGDKQIEKRGREKEQHKSTVYTRTDEKKIEDESDGVDNEEENDVVEENYSCEKKPKERKYSQCPSQTPSRKAPSVCASMKSPSNSVSQQRQKQASYRPSAFVENSAQKGPFEYPSPSKSKVSNASQCNSNMESNKLDLFQLTKQYCEINSEMLKQAKRNHIPLNIIKSSKEDCESEYALTRSNTVSYHNVAPKRMNNNNQYDEEYWGQEYRNGSGSGCRESHKGHAANTRKRTQSIYDDYVQKYK